jgi:hypothetical protein
MNNQHIESYLIEQRDNALASFQAASTVHSPLWSCFEMLTAFDFAAYRQQLRAEILHNVIQWQAPESVEGTEQFLDAVLFEFNKIYDQAVEANAYGIVDWENVGPHVEGFDMGFSYDFRDNFENVPGISLSFLRPLEDLLAPDTIEEMAEIEEGREENPELKSLIDAYLFSGLVSIHNVLVELNKHHAFDRMGLTSSAQFLVGEHDTGVVYPLLFTSSK